MTKILNGRELAGYIKERQAKSVRGLVQAAKIIPKLAIIRTNPDPVVDSYMKLKQSYGDDIGVAVDVHTIDQPSVKEHIDKLNQDPSIYGIIVQIPLPDPSQTDEILNSVAPNKDVDGLALESMFTPATPMAIDWLLAGYNVNLLGKKIVIVGNGRLVGRPLAKMWADSGFDVTVADKSTEDLPAVTKTADVLVSATGRPGLITPQMIKQGAIIVDAGVATDNNGLIGDVAEAVRVMPDVTITAEKGGVGPLTVCALFENVITSAKRGKE